MDDEKHDASDLDDILLEESTGTDEGSADLELDAFQATEIRTIFLTTLPDYLEPVRQMLDQLRSADDPAQMRHALDTTLESIQTAASRVQIDDVSEVVGHMRAQLSGSGPIPEENFDSLWAGLARIETIVADVAANETRPRSETIVSALARVGDIDDGVLEKLTAAGLVTVDQIRMADPSEIMAVSGLDADTVERVVAAVAVRASPSPPDPLETPGVRSAPPDDEPSKDAPPANELEAWLQKQVEGELDLEEKRGQLLRLRTNLLDLHGQLESTETERLALEKSLALSLEKFESRVQTLSQIKTHRSQLERQDATLRQELERNARRMGSLERRAQALQDEQARLSDRVSGVTRTVEKLVDSSRGEG